MKNNTGYGKVLLLICAAITVILFIGAGFDAVGKMLENLSWFGSAIVTIGFGYLMYKLFG
jgi:hypothetical protein